MNIKFYSWLRGIKVGVDLFNNIYYVHRNNDKKRWVVYNNDTETSIVPALWHAWLHGVIDDLPADINHMLYFWQKKHQPNLTGTKYAYCPNSKIISLYKRPKVIGDYQSWRQE